MIFKQKRKARERQLCAHSTDTLPNVDEAKDVERNAHGSK
jgi:hypothetical protein